MVSVVGRVAISIVALTVTIGEIRPNYVDGLIDDKNDVIVGLVIDVDMGIRHEDDDMDGDLDMIRVDNDAIEGLIRADTFDGMVGLNISYAIT